MSNSGIQVLPPGFCYGIVIGIGGFFAALMLGITFLQNRYTLFSTGQSEEFNTASRNVKPGIFFTTVDIDLNSRAKASLLLVLSRPGPGRLPFSQVPPLRTHTASVGQCGTVLWGLSRSCYSPLLQSR